MDYKNDENENGKISSVFGLSAALSTRRIWDVY